MRAEEPRTHGEPASGGKRFRVAFSFAGEKRDFVAKAASILADRFGADAILYDKFHEAEFAVYDLGIRLPKLYGEQSELIVPVLCPDYGDKRWTGWEWVHIYGLLTKADGHRVMPSRFELTIAEGLSPAAGFIELDDKTPAEFADLILERLALNEGHPKDHYKTPTSAGAAPRNPHNVGSIAKRAHMVFVKTECPDKIIPGHPFEAVFWFKNTGNLTAQNVKLTKLEVLIFLPGFGPGIRWTEPYGGPRDVGEGQTYNVRTVSSPGDILTGNTFQVRFTLEYTEFTDDQGSPHNNFINFCEEMMRDRDGFVRWIDASKMPYPKARFKDAKRL
jgi:hypothetical protein